MCYAWITKTIRGSALLQNRRLLWQKPENKTEIPIMLYGKWTKILRSLNKIWFIIFKIGRKYSILEYLYSVGNIPFGIFIFCTEYSIWNIIILFRNTLYHFKISLFALEIFHLRILLLHMAEVIFANESWHYQKVGWGLN